MVPASCMLRPARRSFVRGSSASSVIRHYTLSRRLRQEKPDQAPEQQTKNSQTPVDTPSATWVADPLLSSALEAKQSRQPELSQLKFRPTKDGSKLRVQGEWNPLAEKKVKKRRRLRSGLEYGQLVFTKSSGPEGNFESRGTTLGQAKKERLESSGPLVVLRDRLDTRKRRGQLRSQGKKLGLVPTMGALHEGHLSLIRAAARANDRVWVSIFVNPAQFGPNEDLSSYPRTWSEDLEKLETLNRELRTQPDEYKGYIDAIFAPKVRTMYPSYDPVVGGDPAARTYISVDSKLTGVLEGAARPNFFRGVATVVMKLLLLTEPDRAYFGQKDVQQLSVIKRMVQQFLLGVDIVPVPISRAEDGLALSSRNIYLGERRRKVATVLRRALVAASEAISSGKHTRREVLGAALAECRAELERQRALPPSERARFEIDYISLAGFHDMQETDDVRNVKMAVLSGTIVMLPLEEPQEGEALGQGDDAKPVRLLDNIMMRNPNFRRKQIADPTVQGAKSENPEAQQQQIEGKDIEEGKEADAEHSEDNIEADLDAEPQSKRSADI